MKQTHIQRMVRYKSFSAFCSAVVVLLGLAVLTGWLLELERVKRVYPGLVAMNPLTALGFLLLGAGGLLLQQEPARLKRSVRGLGFGCGALLLVLAGLQLQIHLTGWNAQIDQILFSSQLASDESGHANRMAPNTALNFFLASLSLLWLGCTRPPRILAGQILAAVTLLLALVALMGYAYGAAYLYGVRSFIPMALHTAAGFLLATLGLLLARPRHGLMALITADATGGAMARHLLPAAILVPFVLGAARLVGQQLGHYDTPFGVALFAASTMVIFSGLILLSAASLNRADQERFENERRVRQLNQQLSQRARELEAANGELEAFSYSVSHDLRAPLRHIAGFTELLRKQGGSLNEKGTRYSSLITEATQHMARLIDELLAFSRMGRTELRETLVDLNQLLQDVFERNPAYRDSPRICWTLPRLPAVRGDPFLLRQVLSNLLDNAIKYSRSREPAELSVGSFQEADGSVVVFVRDNGVGFDPTYADKLFKVFQRLHSRSEFEGVGIGLANVRRIITRHGGRTWAEGAPDQGAAFYFSLPPADSPRSDAPSSPPRPAERPNESPSA